MREHRRLYDEGDAAFLAPRRLVIYCAAAMRLFTYKMTHDSGFALNPFHGCCTLATCKPRIRRSKRARDWIAGFTSTQLNGDPVGEERLVYLMQVERKLRLEDYHADPAFAAKIPVADAPDHLDRMGDNVYGVRDGAFFQVPNRNHGPELIDKDLSGVYVLIATRFAYFGSRPLVVPHELRPAVPAGQSAHGAATHDAERAAAFVAYALARGTGIHAPPTTWLTSDASGRRRPRCGPRARPAERAAPGCAPMRRPTCG